MADKESAEDVGVATGGECEGSSGSCCAVDTVTMAACFLSYCCSLEALGNLGPGKLGLKCGVGGGATRRDSPPSDVTQVS